MSSMRNIDSIPVSSFMTGNVKAETADQSIHAACKIMNKNNIGSIIVVKEYTTEPVGIITERDIVRIIGHRSHPFYIYPYEN